MKTPAALGFRMPAEWEPQAAVWLSWPHNRKTWPGHFRPIPGKFAEIVAAISRFEEVRINVAKALQPRAWSLITRAKADRTWPGSNSIITRRTTPGAATTGRFL